MPQSHRIREAIGALNEVRLRSEKEFQAIAADVAMRRERVLRVLAEAGPSTERRLGDVIRAAAPHLIEAIDDLAAEIDAAIAAEIERLEAVLAAEASDGATTTAVTMPMPGRRFLNRVIGLRLEPRLPRGFTYQSARTATVRTSVVNAGTVRQGKLGNCFFVAAMCAVAEKRPALLLNAVEDHGDTVVVTIADRPYGLKRTLPVDAEGRPRFGSTSDGSDFFPFLEKAFAEAHGGYDRIGKGGKPDLALEWITGQGATFEQPDEQMSDQRIQAICGFDRPTVASFGTIPDGDSRKELAKQHDVVESHAYAVRGVDENGDILLHNPWGMFHPKPLPPAVFRQLCSDVIWCD